MPSVPETVAAGRLPNTRAKTLDRHAEWWELRRQGFTVYYIANKFGVSHQAVSKAMLAMEQKLYKVLAEQAAPMKASQTAQLEANLERALLEWFKSQEDAETQRVVEKSIAATSEERDPGPMGGELKRKRKQPLQAGVSVEDPRSNENWEVVDPESIPGYLYNEETDEETTPEEKASVMMAFLAEKLKQEREGGVSTAGLLERTLTKTSQGQCGDPRYLAEIRACLADIRKIWGLDAPTKQELTGKDGSPVLVAFSDALSRVYGVTEQTTDEHES